MARSEKIVISGARAHNLKGIDLELPRDALIVITGLSGSGKSSLAFDTLYAEGQRRYVESLSSYARQFLGLMEKPDVDSIEGLSPAISIDQKTTSRNPRSTVGTVTEIYDYLRLLWARIGKPHCYNCGQPIQGQSLEQITDRVLSIEEGKRFMVMAPVVRGRKGEYGRMLAEMRAQGYARAMIDGELRRLDEEIELDKKYKHDISIVVDRLVMKEGIRKRLSESIEAAAQLADGLIRHPGPRHRRGAGLLGALRLPQLRRLDAGDRAADLLVQLAARRLRALPRARLPAGHRPRADRARPDALDLRGRARPMDEGGLDVPPAPARSGRRVVRDRHLDPVARARPVRARPAAGRHRLREAHDLLQEPLRPPAHLQRAVSRHARLAREALREHGLREHPRPGRGAHGDAAVPGVRRRAPSARVARGHGRRPRRLRVHAPVGAGGARVGVASSS